ncbi:DNA polymerase III subunit delta' [Thiolapillus sp.]
MTAILPWHLDTWHCLQQSLQQGRLPHALLLAGPQGVGKAGFARQLAASLLCERPQATGLACGTCRQCLLLAAGNHPDLRLLLPEEGKTQIGIDAVRELVAGNTLSVGGDAYRVFIIDPAEGMSQAAANALLKTLEEPIEGTLIILLCAQVDRLPVTIRSRCQCLRFALPPEQDAIAWMEGNIQAPPEHALQLLRLANGAPLRIPALIESGELERHNRLLKDFVAIVAGQISAVSASEAWLKDCELPSLLRYVNTWLTALVRQKMTHCAEDAFPLLQSLPERLDLKLLYQLLDKLHEIQRMSSNNLNPQLALESVLLEWGRIANGES